MREDISSLTSDFYQRPVAERISLIKRLGLLDAEAAAHLDAGAGLPIAFADRMVDNLIGTHGLPLSVARNFRVNQRDVLVPMAVEEQSIVAAVSSAAKLVRITGGFVGEAAPPIMTVQVQLDDVPDATSAPRDLGTLRAEILATGDAAIPCTVERGGGCRDLEVRVLSEEHGVVVVHVYVDVGDAMGANIVDPRAPCRWLDQLQGPVEPTYPQARARARGGRHRSARRRGGGGPHHEGKPLRRDRSLPRGNPQPRLHERDPRRGGRARAGLARD
jgi:degradative hydroxymethylglutaryl-CoA reductase